LSKEGWQKLNGDVNYQHIWYFTWILSVVSKSNRHREAHSHVKSNLGDLHHVPRNYPSPSPWCWTGTLATATNRWASFFFLFSLPGNKIKRQWSLCNPCAVSEQTT